MGSRRLAASRGNTEIRPSGRQHGALQKSNMSVHHLWFQVEAQNDDTLTCVNVLLFSERNHAWSGVQDRRRLEEPCQR